MWVLDVLLDDALLVILEVGELLDDGDFATSAQVCWLTDPHLLLTVLGKRLTSQSIHELLSLIWQAVSSGHEVEDVAKHVSIALDKPC